MLGMGQLSAIELEPVDFIRAAAASGLQAVSLFVNQASAQSTFPLTTSRQVSDVGATLDGEGIVVLNVECFMLTPASDIDSYRPAIEVGARLGAQNLVALLYDQDQSRAADNLTQLHDLAAEYQMGVGIEFMPFTPLWKTLPDTLKLIESLALPHLKVAIDCLHLIRSGGGVGDLAHLSQDMISHVQLCDSLNLGESVDYFHEAGVERLAPGEGAFPLVELLAALPAGVAFELEVPQPATVAAEERLVAMVTSARRVLAAAGK